MNFKEAVEQLFKMLSVFSTFFKKDGIFLSGETKFLTGYDICIKEISRRGGNLHSPRSNMACIYMAWMHNGKLKIIDVYTLVDIPGFEIEEKTGKYLEEPAEIKKFYLEDGKIVLKLRVPSSFCYPAWSHTVEVSLAELFKEDPGGDEIIFDFLKGENNEDVIKHSQKDEE